MATSHEDVVVTPAPGARAQRTVGSLFADLARETSRLFRQEIALAKAEVAGHISQMGTGVAELVVGGVVLLTGFLALVAAAIIGIAHALPAWLSCLIMGAFLALVGLVVVLKGRRDIGPDKLVPRRTLRTLKDDAEWAREQMR